MKIIYDNIEILEILNDFSNCTKLTASFQLNTAEFSEYLSKSIKELPSNSNAVDSCANNPNGHFCNFIKVGAGRTACFASDQKYLMQARKERKTIIHACHAGLCDAITPVFIGDMLIGFIMVGMFRDAEGQYSSLEKVHETAERLHLDKEKLTELYNALPVVTKAELTSSLNILKLCISTILNNQFIEVKSFTLIETIRNYIIENLSKNLTIEALCSQFFINRQKLNSLFRKYFNTSVKDFITVAKLDEAKKLLTTTNLSVSEISTRLGFYDYNYFIRTFRRRCNITPLQYRKQQETTV